MEKNERERPLTVDERIVAAVTRRGRRLLTFKELTAEGVPDDSIVRRTRRGSLQRLHRNVYLVGAGDLTAHEKIHFGVVAGGPGSLACASTALGLFGLRNYAAGTIAVAIPWDTTGARRRNLVPPPTDHAARHQTPWDSLRGDRARTARGGRSPPEA